MANIDPQYLNSYTFLLIVLFSQDNRDKISRSLNIQARKYPQPNKIGKCYLLIMPRLQLFPFCLSSSLHASLFAFL